MADSDICATSSSSLGLVRIQDYNDRPRQTSASTLPRIPQTQARANDLNFSSSNDIRLLTKIQASSTPLTPRPPPPSKTPLSITSTSEPLVIRQRIMKSTSTMRHQSTSDHGNFQQDLLFRTPLPPNEVPWADRKRLVPTKSQSRQLPGVSVTSADSSRSAENNKTDSNSINKRPSSEKARPKKKSRRPNLLALIKPDNVPEEKQKFLKLNFDYNPKLTYKHQIRPEDMAKHLTPSFKLFHVAKKIMQNVLIRYQTFEHYITVTSGKKLNRVQILDAANDYLDREGLQSEVSIRMSEDMLARACMTRIRGQPTLQMRPHTIHERWMEGLMRHEVGTHYLRSCNNRQQVWRRGKKRKAMGLRPANPTEEGLASLHTVMFRDPPCLIRSALVYYTVSQASRMSFRDLFKDLGQFVKDPEVRWEYCMRAKRGQEDTSQPGSFCKDQIYLQGAMEILKHRDSIDFHALMRCGKVDFRDVTRLKELADFSQTRIPKWMEDLERYRAKLSEVMQWNGITDQDLDCV